MKYLSQRIEDFSYSSVSEEYNEWADDVTYNVEDEDLGLTNTSVARVGNYYYRTLIDSNLGNDPLDTLDVKWIRWAVSNPYAMFDLRSSTVTASEGANLVVEVPLDLEDMLALGYYAAEDVLIENLDETEGIISGFTIADSADLTSPVTEGLAYIGTPTVRIDTEEDNKTFTASKDTYVDVDANGLVYTEVNNGEADPGVTTDGFRIAKVVTDGTEITSIDDQRVIVTNVVWTQSESQSANEDVIDYFSYMYSDYSLEFNRGILFNIRNIGTKLRISFLASVNIPDTHCGFAVLGNSQDMGDTLYGVKFKFDSFSVKSTDAFGLTTITKRGIQDLVDFETIIPSSSMIATKREVRKIYDDVVVFILDPTDTSRYENLLTLGTIVNWSTVLANPVQTTMAWSIQEVI